MLIVHFSTTRGASPWFKKYVESEMHLLPQLWEWTWRSRRCIHFWVSEQTSSMIFVHFRPKQLGLTELQVSERSWYPWNRYQKKWKASWKPSPIVAEVSVIVDLERSKLTNVNSTRNKTPSLHSVYSIHSGLVTAQFAVLKHMFSQLGNDTRHSLKRTTALEDVKNNSTPFLLCSMFSLNLICEWQNWSHL